MLTPKVNKLAANATLGRACLTRLSISRAHECAEVIAMIAADALPNTTTYNLPGPL
ncbi:protein of unknown function [Pseudomonas sp. JV241A]|nr:protein of unknown function [Pseudomonas sp. JV241A]